MHVYLHCKQAPRYKKGYVNKNTFFLRRNSNMSNNMVFITKRHYLPEKNTFKATKFEKGQTISVGILKILGLQSDMKMAFIIIRFPKHFYILASDFMLMKKRFF